MQGARAIQFITWISAARVGLFAIQGALPPYQPSILQDADRLTLAGALIVAVGVLWRALAKKDEIVVAATKSVTEALIAASESNRELRHVIEASVVAKRELSEAVAELRTEIAARPCMARGKPQEVRHG